VAVPRRHGRRSAPHPRRVKTDRFLADIDEYGVTTAAMVPAIAQFLSMSPATPEDADLPLRNVVMAGALPDPDGFRSRFGVRMCTAYSMTEICTPFTSDGWDVTNWDAVGRLKGGYPGLEVRVLGEDGTPVEPGELGELVIRSSVPSTLNAGYFGMPQATAEAWRDGWFHTGDAFRYDADGFFYFVDRIKDAIRRRGENISSFEVEAIVSGHEEVAECAAVAVPAEMGEDEIKLCVVAVPGRSIDPPTLVAWLADRMPRYMVPRYVEVLDGLPRTMGTLRVQKASLRATGVTAATWDRDARTAG
jgi:crotonobetaine/carnitine-CoA ligase